MNPIFLNCFKSWKVKIFVNFAKSNLNHAKSSLIFTKNCCKIQISLYIARTWSKFCYIKNKEAYLISTFSVTSISTRLAALIKPFFLKRVFEDIYRIMSNDNYHNLVNSLFNNRFFLKKLDLKIMDMEFSQEKCDILRKRIPN